MIAPPAPEFCFVCQNFAKSVPAPDEKERIFSKSTLTAQSSLSLTSAWCLVRSAQHRTCYTTMTSSHSCVNHAKRKPKESLELTRENAVRLQFVPFLVGVVKGPNFLVFSKPVSFCTSSCKRVVMECIHGKRSLKKKACNAIAVQLKN